MRIGTNSFYYIWVIVCEPNELKLLWNKTLGYVLYGGNSNCNRTCFIRYMLFKGLKR